MHRVPNIRDLVALRVLQRQPIREIALLLSFVSVTLRRRLGRVSYTRHDLLDNAVPSLVRWTHQLPEVRDLFEPNPHRHLSHGLARPSSRARQSPYASMSAGDSLHWSVEQRPKRAARPKVSRKREYVSQNGDVIYGFPSNWKIAPSEMILPYPWHKPCSTENFHGEFCRYSWPASSSGRSGCR